MRRITLITLLAIGGLIGHATRLRADIVFTNIVGNCCGGYGVAGSNYTTESLAETFTPSANYVLTDAQVVVFQVEGFGGDPFFNVSLFSDAAGLPGSSVATLGTHLTAPVGGGTITASGATPVLASGTPYWLVLTPFDNGTEVGWEENGNSLLAPATTLSSTGEGGWTSTGAGVGLQFQVDGTPLPEPAMLLLVTPALALMVFVRMRKSHKAS